MNEHIDKHLNMIPVHTCMHRGCFRQLTKEEGKQGLCNAHQPTPEMAEPVDDDEEVSRFSAGDAVPDWILSCDPPEALEYKKFGIDVVVLGTGAHLVVMPAQPVGVDASAICLKFKDDPVYRGSRIWCHATISMNPYGCPGMPTGSAASRMYGGMPIHIQQQDTCNCGGWIHPDHWDMGVRECAQCIGKTAKARKKAEEDEAVAQALGGANQRVRR